MGKLLFVIKRLKKFNVKAMFSTAKTISKKIKKTYIFVLADIICCGIRYQAGYNDYLEFEFYLLNKEQRKTYLTAGINNSIIKKYNNKEYWHMFDDKIEFNSIFSKYIGREWLDIRETTVENFARFMQKHPLIIVKPIDECGGKGVEKISSENYNDVCELYDQLIKNKQFLVEECVVQNCEMSKLYDGSVNTLRMFTFHDSNSCYLQGILKLGNGGHIDNFSSGGMYTFVDETGTVIVPAIDKGDNVYTVHPISNEKIIGFKVPMFEQAKQLVCDAAKVVPQVGYVGWDVAITENGPIIIEGNCYPGVFQIKPSFSKDKNGILSEYMKYMKI